MYVHYITMKLPIALMFIFIAVRRRPSDRTANVNSKAAGVVATLLFITLLGFVGCTNADPLAVASGPFFALNAGHWQPAPQNLAGPPMIAKE